MNFYGMDGSEISRDEWIGLYEGDSEETRRVAQTEIGDVTISTVLLGIDHAFGGGPPLIFETMIFGGEHDQYQERYSTREQAEEGHEKAVALVAEPLTTDECEALGTKEEPS